MSRSAAPTPDLFENVPPATQATRELTRRDADLAINDLYGRALTAGDPGAWMAGFLTFIGRMRHYSIFNANLIYMQCPGALAVGTPRYWAAHHRTVRPGARPLVILAPRSPYVLVYELEDTEGRTLFDEPFIIPSTGSIRAWDSFRQRTEAFGRPSGVADAPGIFRVIEDALGTTRHGDVYHQRDAQDRILVRINRTKPPSEKHLTLMHELAHVFCGHVGQHPATSIPARPDLDRLDRTRRQSIVEFEAEAVAWLLATRSGMEAGSVDYLASFVRTLDLASLDVAAILHAANRIEPLAFVRRSSGL